MPVPVVDVRVVRMLVGQHYVLMWVHVRLVTIPGEDVLVLMMCVVEVRVCVFERLVRVLVFVPLLDVQPHPQGHQGTGHPERR
jgi:hypothetical protein